MLSLPHARCVALAALVAAVVAVGCKKSKPTDAGGDTDTPAGTPGGGPGPAGGGAPGAGGPPARWSEARDTVGGFKVYVFGTNRALDMTTAPAEKKQLQMTMMINHFGPKDKAAAIMTYSLVPPAGFKIGSSPDELYAALLLHQKGLMTFQDVLSKESVKLGGQPGLKVMTKASNLSPPTLLNDPAAAQLITEGYKKDVARRRTYFVTATATRVIVIMAQTEGDPDPAELKTLADSFSFL